MLHPADGLIPAAQIAFPDLLTHLRGVQLIQRPLLPDLVQVVPHTGGKARQISGAQCRRVPYHRPADGGMDDVALEFSDEAINKIVDETMDKGLGARGLRGTTEKVLEDFMFDITKQKTILLSKENINI